MTDQHRMPFASRTDVGQRREHNEDSIVASPPLIAVADGVGGSAKGEVASKLALEALVSAAPPVATARTSREAASAMEQAVLASNTAVHEAQLRDESLRGMATTLTAAVARDGGEIVIGHVGDSRLYIISAVGARQATDDHSVVAELVRSGRLPAADAAHHPQRNAITRALGPEADVTVDAFVIHVGPGDWLLACSDGLTEHVADAEMARALMEHPAEPDAAVGRLVDLANERGGTDNISVAVMQPVPSDVSGELSVQALEAAAASTAQISAQDAGPDPESAATATQPAIDVSPPSAADTSLHLPVLEPLDHEHPPPIPQAPTARAENEARESANWRFMAIAGLLLVLAVVAGGYVWSQSYFLVERQDGRVGIDQGFPFARLASPHRSSDVRASDLPASDQERLVESHRIMSRDDAERLLDQLPDRVDSARGPSGDAEEVTGDEAPPA